MLKLTWSRETFTMSISSTLVHASATTYPLRIHIHPASACRP